LQLSSSFCSHLVSFNRLWNGESKKPERVDDEVKLFNDGPKELGQEPAVALRVRAGFDQSLGSSVVNVKKLFSFIADDEAK